MTESSHSHSARAAADRLSVDPRGGRGKQNSDEAFGVVCLDAAIVLLALAALLLCACRAPAQTWNKGSYLHPGGDCPPFVFVSMPKSSSNFGCDAHADEVMAGRLDLGAPGRQLWFMDRSLNAPRLLFPLPGHQQLVQSGVALSRGSVHEPTVYHHAATGQYWVFFSFAADLVDPWVTRPCSLYAINITAAVQQPQSFQPDTLPIVRLDQGVNHSVNDLLARSFNPDLMVQGPFPHLVAWPGPNGPSVQYETNTGACVVDAEHGPVLMHTSNVRRTDGERMFAGDLEFTANSVRMLNRNEIMHFGTTSVLSLFETPRGAAGSYRSSTEATGQWGVFEFYSDLATWQTVSGYANQNHIADHNGTTLTIGEDPDDSVIAVCRYYVGNNEGFGTIVLLPYSEVGRNDDDGATTITQKGVFTNAANTTNLFPHIPEFSDAASASGKFALPAAGRKANGASSVELFLTYSRATSHGSKANAYDAALVVVTDISQKILPVGNTYLPNLPGYPIQLVLEHPNLHLFAMKPVLTSSERFGWRHRDVLPLNGRLDPAGLPADLVDMPVAQVIAGPIQDTDIKSMTARVGGYYDPTTEPRNNNGTDRIAVRLSCLTKSVNPGWYEDPAHRDEVWGLRVFVTDERVRKLIDGTSPFSPLSHWGYLHHDGGGEMPFGDVIDYERYRHLSDVPADANGKVNFYVPANLPMKLQLLHRDGTVLAAQRGHHSFTVGQLERRCVGCHEHVDPVAHTATASSPALDLLHRTGRYTWDQAGNPTFQWLNEPSHAVPEFRADIFPLLQSECASCHDSAVNANGSGLSSGFDLRMTPPGSNDRQLGVWLWLNRMRYVNRRLGAAKSPLAWHFTGVASDNALRLDGEPNSRYKGTLSNGLPGFYSDSSLSRYWITVVPGANNPHPGVADQRKAYKVIEWIDSGAAIDHGAFDAQGNPDPRRGVKGDGYQIAVSVRLQGYTSANVRIGYWDVADNVERVEVTLRNSKRTYNVLGQGNGVLTHDLLSHNVNQAGPSDVLRVHVIDTAGNVSRVEKTLRQLLYEAEHRRGELMATSNERVYRGGDTMTITLDGPPSLAHRPYLHVLSDDIYPPTFALQQFGIYALPTPGPWFNASLTAGVLGNLGGQGNGSWSLTFPAVIPPAELYCQILAIDGTSLVKSNVVPFKLR